MGYKQLNVILSDKKTKFFIYGKNRVDLQKTIDTGDLEDKDSRMNLTLAIATAIGSERPDGVLIVKDKKYLNDIKKSRLVEGMVKELPKYIKPFNCSPDLVSIYEKPNTYEPKMILV